MQENQRITLTKRLLKEGLVRLLQKKDMDKIGVSELCAESGINRATFYRHYEIPLDVLHEIQQDFISGGNIVMEEPKSLQEIADNFERICVYMKQNELLTKTLLKHSSDQDFSYITKAYTQKLIETKYGNMMDEESIRLIVKGIAGGAYALLKAWLLEDSPKTPKELAELMARFISYGSKLF